MKLHDSPKPCVATIQKRRTVIILRSGRRLMSSRVDQQSGLQHAQLKRLFPVSAIVTAYICQFAFDTMRRPLTVNVASVSFMTSVNEGMPGALSVAV